MRLTLLVILLFASFNSFGDEYPSCDIAKRRQFVSESTGEEYKISAKIFGDPCYKAKFTISVALMSGSLLYEYEAPFKQHNSVHWEDPELDKAAEELATMTVDPFEIFPCSKLPEVNQSDPWEWNKQLVSPTEYNLIRKEDCWVITHPIGNEAIRLIAFSGKWVKAIPLRDSGL